MFERNKVDNVEHNGTPVELTLDSGEVLTGRLMIAVGRNPVEVLNSAGGFIEFEPWGGERIFVAKASMRNIKMVQQAKVASLAGRTQSANGFDPYTILGVRTDADLDTVKAAWHRLAKAYHPDRYASAELPEEVVEYLSAMARRVNAAYAALEAPLVAARKMATRRTAPIYTSRRHA